MGTTMSPYGEPFLAILLSRIGLMISVSVLPISDAVHCNRSRSALQPLPQCTASVLAVHCIFSHKRLRDKTPFWGISSSMFFLLSLVFS